MMSLPSNTNDSLAASFISPILIQTSLLQFTISANSSLPPPPLINKRYLVSFATSKATLVMVSSFHTTILLQIVDSVTLIGPPALPLENQ